MSNSDPQGNSHPKVLCLTFDDGPHLHLTPKILQTLRAAHAKATFFVVGEQLKRAGALAIVARAFADGHTIGNHSMTHSDLTKCSEREIETEISGTASLLRPLGIDSTVFRPPYGRINEAVVMVIRRLGYQLVLWNNDPRDWARDSQPVKWVANAIAGVHQRGATTIVCHDTHETTANNVSHLLGRLAREGYRFASWEETQKELDLRGSVFQRQSPTSSALGLR